MQIDFPFRIDGRGRTAAASEEKHVRDLIEQLLFTAPGERVNRPDFGSGLMQLVFAGNSEELATATQFLAQGALQQWLGERIQVIDVRAEARDSTLQVTVEYSIRGNPERKVAEFTREA